MNHTDLWNVVKIIWLQDNKKEIYFEWYLIDNRSQVDDLYIFVQHLILFGTRMRCCLSDIQMFYCYFYHSSLLLDLKYDIHHLTNFNLVISPRCFQISHQPQTRNSGYWRQYPAVCVKVKCLQIFRFVFQSYQNRSRFLYKTCITMYFRHWKYMKIDL
jgi:hypothetical protein